MSAAEYNFPNPPGGQLGWLGLAVCLQPARWPVGLEDVRRRRSLANASVATGLELQEHSVQRRILPAGRQTGFVHGERVVCGQGGRGI